MLTSARHAPRLPRPLFAAWWRSLLRYGVCIGLCVVACVVALAFHTQRVAAANYTVNASTDSGVGVGTTGDLRYVITQVNTGSDLGNTITFSVTGPITLNSALPALNKPVAITGPTGDAEQRDVRRLCRQQRGNGEHPPSPLPLRRRSPARRRARAWR